MFEDLFNCLGEKERENGEKTVRGLCAVEVAGSSGRFM